jgi:DNA-binding phage protein
MVSFLPLAIVQQIKKLRRTRTVPEIMRQTSLSKASVYRALSSGVGL